MSGMQGISGGGSMPQNCNMKSMHENSAVKAQTAAQADTKKQSAAGGQDKIINQNFGSKIDIKI